MAWTLSRSVSYKVYEKEGVPSYEVTPYLTFNGLKLKSDFAQIVSLEGKTDLIEEYSADMIKKLHNKNDVNFGDVSVMFSRLYFRTREASENKDMFLRDGPYRREENAERYDRLHHSCDHMQRLIGAKYGTETLHNMVSNADAFYRTSIQCMRQRPASKTITPHE